MNPIPHDATVPIQNAFRALNKRLDEMTKRPINMNGHQIVNLGEARSGSEAVTLRQLHRMSEDQNVRTEVHKIINTVSAGPWTRIGVTTSLNSIADQVLVGTSTVASAVPRVYIRGTGGAAASFPTITANDWLVVENSGNTGVAIITGATNNGAIRFFGSGDAAVDGRVEYNRNTRNLTFMAAATDRVRITSAGSVLLQVAGALATTATDGFTYIPTCAGTPTGVPTAQTGMAAMVYDTTNNVLYVYAGGAWRTH